MSVHQGALKGGLEGQGPRLVALQTSRTPQWAPLGCKALRARRARRAQTVGLGLGVGVGVAVGLRGAPPRRRQARQVQRAQAGARELREQLWG